MRCPPVLAGMLVALGCTCRGDGAPAQDAGSPTTAAPRKTRPAVPPGPPMREAQRTEVEETIVELGAFIRAGATDPTNAWAMAHGLIGFSRDLTTRDGRKVVDVLVTDFVTDRKVAGRTVYGFPAQSPDGVPVEPHPDLIAKTLLDAGVPLDRSFTLQGPRPRVKLKRLVDDAAWTFTFPRTDRQWQGYAWSLELFVLHPGAAGTIETHTGTLRVADLVREGLSRLEKEQAFLQPLHAAGRPDRLEKRRQGIYAHSCGGLHLAAAGIYGAITLGDPRATARAHRQVDLLLFRWDAERRLYREMILRQPRYRWPLLIQELKFHGHLLETLAGLAGRRNVVSKDDDHLERTARRVTADLIDTIVQLRPLFRTQDKLRVTTPQAYYDLIGDGAHALRGLKRASVAFFAL